MGYFSNGTEGRDWEAKNCTSCVHKEECDVLIAHLLFNYDECNNPESILHILIPYEDGVNGKCTMRFERTEKEQGKSQ